MGRAGFVSGAVYAQNLQSGAFTVTLGGTGTDTATVTFKEFFEKAPKVSFGKKSAAVLSDAYVSGVSLSGFTMNVKSSSLTGTVSFDYIASDLTYN